MTFLDALTRGTNLTTTENGATTNASSLDPVVDFFGLAGAMRSTPDKAADLFEKAFHYDPTTAVRTLFYLRDVRGGQGERDVFRAGLKRLAIINPVAVAKLFEHIPFYGRWDDVFFNGVTIAAAEVVQAQLNRDMMAAGQGESASLLAKWLPSENASSRQTTLLAKALRGRLHMTASQYRRTLSFLRANIRLLEQDMSSSNWEGIDYSKLPGQAHRRHTKAFKRHTPDRYAAYLDSVKKGEAKINVGTVYPHEIYKMVAGNGYYSAFEDNQYANVAWENLPDYTNGKNALVMADVSGSMAGHPIAVSVSLALYFAERNTGAFKDHFMTFSSTPKLVKVMGNTLAQKMSNISQAEWQQNTNLLAAFRAILSASLQSGDSPPETLYIISDMEFDSANGAGGWHYEQRQVPVTDWTGRRGYRIDTVAVHNPLTSTDTIFETAKREFAERDLTLPHVVFWNVNARNMQTPALANDGHVSLVSGCSPTVFGMAVQGLTPRQLVDQVVNSDRYGRIIL